MATPLMRSFTDRNAGADDKFMNVVLADACQVIRCSKKYYIVKGLLLITGWSILSVPPLVDEPPSGQSIKPQIKSKKSKKSAASDIFLNVVLADAYKYNTDGFNKERNREDVNGLLLIHGSNIISVRPHVCETPLQTQQSKPRKSHTKSLGSGDNAAPSTSVIQKKPVKLKRTWLCSQPLQDLQAGTSCPPSPGAVEKVTHDTCELREASKQDSEKSTEGSPENPFKSETEFVVKEEVIESFEDFNIISQPEDLECGQVKEEILLSPKRETSASTQYYDSL